MEIRFTKSFKKDYKKLSQEIKKQLDKQLLLFLENIDHSSLRIKKMKGHLIIWEGRINKNYRFTFEVKKNLYIIRRAGNHSILDKP